MNNLQRANQRLKDIGINEELMIKWQSLITELASYDSAVIAYSGGVDSSFLAYAACLALGRRMVAVTVVSPIEPTSILDAATRFAEAHGFKQDTIPYDPLQNPDFQLNTPERCYHCKKSILNILWDFAREHQMNTVLEGQNADDLSDYRPGRKAVAETGTLSPLAHNRLSKAEIRQLAGVLELSNWNQPSTPCLATRIPYGTIITKAALERIAQAEQYLDERGFKIVRVRCHDDLARIEIETDKMPGLLAIKEDLVRHFKEIGFRYITLDVQGYRLGSMNEGLTL